MRHDGFYENLMADRRFDADKTDDRLRGRFYDDGRSGELSSSRK